MTVCPYWPEEGPALAAAAGDADIGLHLTLTDQAPLGAMPEFAPSGRLPPIGKVVRAGLLGRLPTAEIEAEIERQLEAFVAIWKRPPAHVDGHHHVHQLPGVRGALLSVLSRRGGPRPYLRSCHEPLSRALARGVAWKKALVISALGAGFARTAAAEGFAMNNGFSGAYDLMMCHPGYSDTTLAGLDSMTAQRDAELAFLASDEWSKVLAAAGCVVAPFKAI